LLILADYQWESLIYFSSIRSDELNSQTVLAADREKILPFRPALSQWQAHFQQPAPLHQRKIRRKKPARLRRFEANRHPALRHRLTVGARN
jgi:hypothetical protein